MFREHARATSKEDLDQYGWTCHGTHPFYKRIEGFTESQCDSRRYGEVPHSYEKGATRFALTNSWVSIYGHGSFAPEHVHTLCHLSVCSTGLFPKVLVDIIMRNPAMDTFSMLYGAGVDLFTDLHVKSPKKGQMVIFPFLYAALHKTSHMANDDRIIFVATRS